MSKKTHTWKIGEYCKGGIITVEINGNTIHIIGKEWDYSKGSNKGSDQSGAEEFDRCTITADGSVDCHREASNFLHDLTTSYYAEQVMEWIEKNSEAFKKHMFW